MTTDIEKFTSNKSVALPQGTTKTNIKVEGMNGFDVAISSLYGTGIGVFLSFGPIIFASTFIEMVTMMATGAISGATLMPILAQRYNTWFDADDTITHLTGKMPFQTGANPFNTQRTLTEKRRVLHIVKDEATGSVAEVHLVTNRKGVWVEKVEQKGSTALWDDSMKAVENMYSLSASAVSPKELST